MSGGVLTPGCGLSAVGLSANSSRRQEANAIRMTLAEKDDYVDLLLFIIGILFAFLAFVVEFGGGGEEGVTT